MCRCKHASAMGVPVGWGPVVVFIARGGARRDVADARVRLERVLQPHIGCCFVLHLLAHGCSCTCCAQRECCDPRWELAGASG